MKFAKTTPLLLALALLACNRSEKPPEKAIEISNDGVKVGDGVAVGKDGVKVGGADGVTVGKDGKITLGGGALEVGPGKAADGLANASNCVQGECKVTCPAGKPCNATCSGGNCSHICDKGATCQFSCAGG